jgi:hypothetical protein
VSDDLRAYDPDKPVSLPGRKCAYCGVDLERRTTTRDHVVARNFVPEGTLASGFFLQVKACRPCNDRKAALEDDISIITMLPDTLGRYVRDDDRLTRTVARKARGAISPATRRLAAQSYNQIEASIPIGGGASLTYKGVAMPTLDSQRVARLAYFHVQGFYHFRSFDPQRGHGAWFQPNQFLTLGHLTRDDWGNPQIGHFTNATRAWEPTCAAILADGYFRHEMRKKPGAELYSWVVEWNERLRVYGLYGDASERDAFVANLPRLTADLSYGDTTNGFAMRTETPLVEEDDLLFDLPADFADRPHAAPHWRTADDPEQGAS